MVVSEVNNDRHEHRESLVLVGLQDVQEVVIFKEAHRSVSHLQVDASNASHDPLEEFRNQMLDFVHFANLQDFLQLSQEKCLLDAVGERPVLEQSLEKCDGESSIFGKEEH